MYQGPIYVLEGENRDPKVPFTQARSECLEVKRSEHKINVFLGVDGKLMWLFAVYVLKRSERVC